MGGGSNVNSSNSENSVYSVNSVNRENNVLAVYITVLPPSLMVFLSDPGPIIVYPCQSLTDSLTNDLVED